MQTENVRRVIALRIEPTVVAVCNAELAPRARIVAARDAHAACRMIASGGAVVVVSRSTPFWDMHVVREHAERCRMPIVDVADDALPFEIAREVEGAIASSRHGRDSSPAFGAARASASSSPRAPASSSRGAPSSSRGPASMRRA